MRRIHRTVLVCLAIVLGTRAPSMAAPPPVCLWGEALGGFTYDELRAVALDADGNVYITGSFSGPANFGGETFVNEAGKDAAFVAKLSPSGEHRWSRALIGTPGQSSGALGTSIALAPSGQVVVVGSFTGVADIDGTSLLSAGAQDAFVLVLSPYGGVDRSLRFGSTGLDEATGVTVDANGNIVVLGRFSGTIQLGATPLVSAGLSDIVLASFSPTLAHNWSQRFGGTGAELPYGVTVDSGGVIAATGAFKATVNFGGASLVSAGGDDIFLARYKQDGSHVWSKRFGGAGTDTGTSVAVDAAGNVYVDGAFQQTVNFGGGNLTSAGDQDAFVAKFSSGGTHQWSTRFGNTGADALTGIGVDAAGNVFVSGFFSLTVDLGGGPLVGGTDLSPIVASYTTAGGHRWSRAPQTASAIAWGLDVLPSGGVAVGGVFIDTIDPGNGTLVSSLGAADVFVARYGTGQPEPLITSIDDVGNDQGRKVRIRFERSALDDADAQVPVSRYVAFRRDDPAPAAATPHDLANLSERELRAAGWVEVGDVGAYGEDAYAMDAPTVGDSTETLGQYYSVFYIRAATATPARFYDSVPDSGYSVDNLAPGIPGSLLYNAGLLTWHESPAADFDYFSVYGAATDDFASATLVDYTVATQMDVASAGYAFYFVTATDFSGNEGKPAGVNTTSNAGSTPRTYVLSISAYPNPFNPATTVRYTIPAAGRVTVTIFDARGARIATLADAERGAGAYTERWNGADDAGRPVSSGVYFARVTHAGNARTYKLVLMK